LSGPNPEHWGGNEVEHCSRGAPCPTSPPVWFCQTAATLTSEEALNINSGWTNGIGEHGPVMFAT
jgi:hypothetical protein